MRTTTPKETPMTGSYCQKVANHVNLLSKNTITLSHPLVVPQKTNSKFDQGHLYKYLRFSPSSHEIPAQYRHPM